MTKNVAGILGVMVSVLIALAIITRVPQLRQVAGL